MNCLDMTKQSIHLPEPLSVHITNVRAKLEVNNVSMASQTRELSTADLAPVACFFSEMNVPFVDIQLFAAVETLGALIANKRYPECFLMSLLVLAEIGVGLV